MKKILFALLLLFALPADAQVFEDLSPLQVSQLQEHYRAVVRSPGYSSPPPGSILAESDPAFAKWLEAIGYPHNPKYSAYRQYRCDQYHACVWDGPDQLRPNPGTNNWRHDTFGDLIRKVLASAPDLAPWQGDVRIHPFRFLAIHWGPVNSILFPPPDSTTRPDPTETETDEGDDEDDEDGGEDDGDDSDSGGEGGAPAVGEGDLVLSCADGQPRATGDIRFVPSIRSSAQLTLRVTGDLDCLRGPKGDPGDPGSPGRPGVDGRDGVCPSCEDGADPVPVDPGSRASHLLAAADYVPDSSRPHLSVGPFPVGHGLRVRVAIRPTEWSPPDPGGVHVLLWVTPDITRQNDDASYVVLRNRGKELLVKSKQKVLGKAVRVGLQPTELIVEIHPDGRAVTQVFVSGVSVLSVEGRVNPRDQYVWFSAKATANPETPSYGWAYTYTVERFGG